MSRVRLGRHGQLDSDAGDPLDGLVNLFDLGIVLAVAFLIAGLTIAAAKAKTPTPAQNSQTRVTAPSAAPTASGQGTEVGQVYQLPNGQLVLVKPSSSP